MTSSRLLRERTASARDRAAEALAYAGTCVDAMAVTGSWQYQHNLFMASAGDGCHFTAAGEKCQGPRCFSHFCDDDDDFSTLPHIGGDWLFISPRLFHLTDMQM